MLFQCAKALKCLQTRMHVSVEEFHGFRRQRGTHTTIGETKLDTYIATCESETLHQVFLDLREAYDSIDQERVLDLLRRYGMRPRLCAYVGTVWEILVFVLRQAQFYSDKVNVNRGCTQGGVDFTPVFNIIIDAMLRMWHQRSENEKSKSRFYADDGLVQNTDPHSTIIRFKLHYLNVRESWVKG